MLHCICSLGWSLDFCFPYMYWGKGSTSKEDVPSAWIALLPSSALCDPPSLAACSSYLTSLEAALDLGWIGVTQILACLLYWSWHRALELAGCACWKGCLACCSLRIEVNGLVMCIWQCFSIIVVNLPLIWFLSALPSFRKLGVGLE